MHEWYYYCIDIAYISVILWGYVLIWCSCGDCGVDTKERYLEILEFTHFVTFFSFNKIGENHKEKILVKKVTVVVALDLGTGNTKILTMKVNRELSDIAVDYRDT